MKPQKELRKKLKNKFMKNVKEYGVITGIKSWLEQCGIEYTEKKLEILVTANGGKLFYPYQEADRKRIIKWLKHEHKK